MAEQPSTIPTDSTTQPSTSSGSGDAPQERVRDTNTRFNVQLLDKAFSSLASTTRPSSRVLPSIQMDKSKKKTRASISQAEQRAIHQIRNAIAQIDDLNARLASYHNKQATKLLRLQPTESDADIESISDPDTSPEATRKRRRRDSDSDDPIPRDSKVARRLFEPQQPEPRADDEADADADPIPTEADDSTPVARRLFGPPRAEHADGIGKPTEAESDLYSSGDESDISDGMADHIQLLRTVAEVVEEDILDHYGLENLTDLDYPEPLQ